MNPHPLHQRKPIWVLQSNLFIWFRVLLSLKDRFQLLSRETHPSKQTDSTKTKGNQVKMTLDELIKLIKFEKLNFVRICFVATLLEFKRLLVSWISVFYHLVKHLEKFPCVFGGNLICIYEYSLRDLILLVRSWEEPYTYKSYGHRPLILKIPSPWALRSYHTPKASWFFFQGIWSALYNCQHPS